MNQPLSDDYAIIIIEIGTKGRLDAEVLHGMAGGPVLAHLRYPKAVIGLSISGYDEDPRSLWDIPEASDYVRQYAKASGLHNWRTSLFNALDDDAKALLISCDAIEMPHPFALHMKNPR